MSREQEKERLGKQMSIENLNDRELRNLADRVCSNLWLEQNDEVDQQKKFYNSIPMLSDETDTNPLELPEIENLLQKFIDFWNVKINQQYVDMYKTNFVSRLEVILQEIKKRKENLIK